MTALRCSIAILILIGALQGAAQNAPPAAGQHLSFDAASVKPSAREAAGAPDENGMVIVRKQPGAFRSGGPGTNDPGRIHYPNTILRSLLVEAYGAARFQIQGPAWLDEDRFDIDATMPPQTTREQFHLMLQNLIAERFKMAVHRETREFSGYALVVAKGGAKLKESVEVAGGQAGATPQAAANTGRPAVGPDGFPVSLPAGRGGRGGDNIPGAFGPNGWKMFFQRKTMGSLANYLRERLERPVTDATGLTSKYDFSLTFLPEDWPAPPAGGRYPPAPDLFAALQTQLGLKLVARKIAAEVIVIDHIERTPTAN